MTQTVQQRGGWMRTLKSWLMAGCLVLVTAQFCSAAGFAIYEWSARDFALGGATVGRADDPAALATNPAGITQLEGIQVMAGVMPIKPLMTIETPGRSTDSDDSSVFFPPHFYATWKVNDRYSIGLGTFSRFGLGTKFDDNWAGRYNSYEATIESMSINPNVAVKVTDNFSAAFGVEAMYLHFTQKKKLDITGAKTPALDGDAKLEADGVGYGFNMALHYQPCDYAKLGLTYRSPVTMKVTGDADFSNIPSAASPLFSDTSAKGVVTLPDSFSFGLALYPMEKLSVELGAVYTLWSKYDELKIDFGDNVIPVRNSAGAVVGTTDQTVSKKNWDDVWRLNVGVEYAALDWLDVRLGYVWDQSPAKDSTIDYLLPDSDRHMFSGGLGFHKDNWGLDMSYSFLMFEDRDIKGRDDGVLDGKVKDAHAHIAGLSFTYKF
ncbi:MAG: OmpP1/FadL family transporter [Desulfomicrobium sp.]|nr:OmpP1/FadL family transporter [Desulfomicrobium sp.]